MKLDKLNEFIKFMNENDLCELEVEEEGKRVRLKKSSQDHPVIVSQISPQNKLEQSREPEKEQGLVEINSPMVGTFYRAPSPGTKPYVEVGDDAKLGDIICIIEAMKLMNEIKADREGKIVQILVENGESVEFGQTLFMIKPI
ncbi:MAG: acetyl-CoA carboxylase biotin carboxyl carrier protein [Candidatus Omnitrophica bacterium]|nr:acetyl-CoA carboxylase biotin carboxyl carrier protein [Candidatus Omnitrophota bacterium]MBU0896988.1 acetyl-CoA carboxylase biotin carboxyl carrier protein [Candidatus Omnitrophota bacterium]MBU1133748.1 acetyl-CoA carboxylase biotin carboxyl carrier protein [Candidatus Omnitrophota bacterium]MBU1366749.1 acetyl-CoA carboxylase biotin carboxyl carrier protein [Candidatus Omnitrophota bacterium]MBU1524135.1 acetyl-CoA carboxylase biotin carboxyl carrier protein [Candidatus Omnitrophota bact